MSKKLYQVFVKDTYVRDSQMFVGRFADSAYTENDDDLWEDNNAPLLVMEDYFESDEDVVKQLRIYFPDVSPDVFYIYGYESITKGNVGKISHNEHRGYSFHKFK